MVDIFNEVYSNLKTALVDVCRVEREVPDTAVFPVLVIKELSNTNDLAFRDSAGDTYDICAYEIDIFTNSPQKFTEMSSIKEIVNNLLSKEYNMNRSFSEPTPNFADSTVYRWTMRYSFRIDKNKTIYRS